MFDALDDIKYLLLLPVVWYVQDDVAVVVFYLLEGVLFFAFLDERLEVLHRCIQLWLVLEL